MYQSGVQTDLSLITNLTPVISERLGEKISSLGTCRIQRIPVIIKGVKEKYEILNILSIIDVIDYEKSKYIQYFRSPQRSGEIEIIYGLRVKHEPINSAIFRLFNWEITIIVTGDFLLEVAYDFSGMYAEQISGIFEG